MEPFARCLLARVMARRGEHDGAEELVALARGAATGSNERRLVGPVAIAAVETELARGKVRRPRRAGRAGPGQRGGAADRTIAAELTRYLQWAGLDVPGVGAAPEPGPAASGGTRAPQPRSGASGASRTRRRWSCSAATDPTHPPGASSSFAALGAAGTLRVVAAGRASG